jgi:hypothetical protein
MSEAQGGGGGERGEFFSVSYLLHKFSFCTH